LIASPDAVSRCRFPWWHAKQFVGTPPHRQKKQPVVVGEIGHRRLRPGRYRSVLSATPMNHEVDSFAAGRTDPILKIGRRSCRSLELSRCAPQTVIPAPTYNVSASSAVIAADSIRPSGRRYRLPEPRRVARLHCFQKNTTLQISDRSDRTIRRLIGRHRSNARRTDSSGNLQAESASAMSGVESSAQARRLAISASIPRSCCIRRLQKGKRGSSSECKLNGDISVVRTFFR